jgi:tight adherence protein B
MMLMVVVMFVVGVGLVLGANFLLTKLPAILEQRRLNQRLMDVAGTPEPVQQGTEESLVMRDVSGPLPAVDRLVSSTQAGTWLTKLIQQAGVRTTPSAIAVSSIVLGAVFALAARMFAAGIPFLPFLVFLVGASVPVSVLLYKRSARLAKFEEQFPEALDLLARALRAGHAFQTAMGMVADDLKEPVGPEFKRSFDQQNYGLPLRDTLFQLADRIPLLDVRFFATAVLIQRDTGGNLAEILDNLAHVVRERFKIRRQIRTHTAHGRFTGFVLLALPAGLAVILTMLSPDHMGPLFTHRLGQTMIMAAVVMQTVGFLWIRKILQIEV